MWRVVVSLESGGIKAKNCKSKEECEDFVLETAEKIPCKKYIMVNKDNIKERYSDKL